MFFLLRWLLSTLAVIIAAYILPGVGVDSFFAALVVTLILGLVNTFVKPVLVILTLPLTIATLGLFYLVINAVLFLLVDALVPGFAIQSFWWALLFSVVLSMVSFALNRIAEPHPYGGKRTQRI